MKQQQQQFVKNTTSGKLNSLKDNKNTYTIVYLHAKMQTRALPMQRRAYEKKSCPDSNTMTSIHFVFVLMVIFFTYKSNIYIINFLWIYTHTPLKIHEEDLTVCKIWTWKKSNKVSSIAQYTHTNARVLNSPNTCGDASLFRTLSLQSLHESIHC